MPSMAAPARIFSVGVSDANFEILQTALRGAGQADVRAGTTAQALEAIAGRSVELMILDLTLPGAEIVKVMQAAAPGGGARSRVPVILLAPPGAEERVASCLQHGAEDYIATPLDGGKPVLIVRRIQLCLQRRWLRDATVRLKSRAGVPEETVAIELHTNASSRFVPREFLENLGRQSLTDVRLGDHVERDMTVFFSDIRDFTALSESLTPQENFDFLNSYLRQVTPIIRARHGFVDKYIGDAIMALFPRSAGDALNAAVELQARVVSYNDGRRAARYQPVQIGIGLHRGPLILGTIGEEERMQTTVIADAVNVASRIEGLTKTYGVSLLVSGSVVDALDQTQRDRHNLRNLGAVKAKGKASSVEIFECFDNDPPELIEHKQRTGGVFAAGLEQFRQGLILTAGKIFTQLAEINPNDTVAVHYRDTCTMDMVRSRGNVKWDGADRVFVK